MKAAWKREGRKAKMVMVQVMMMMRSRVWQRDQSPEE